ncbi:biotin synthase BioB [bacterium]|nr:biotin synthase BioB [bacterium]
MIEVLAQKIIDGGILERSEAEEIVALPTESKEALLIAASRVRHHFVGREIATCSITNAKSGLCSEDCLYCAQSAHHATTHQPYSLISSQQMEAAYKSAGQYSQRHSFVMSGRGPNDAEVEAVCSATRNRSENDPKICASLGIATKEQLQKLKDAGVNRYHHNMESSRRYFSKVTTTHSWEERKEVAFFAKEIGLSLCSGGLFGLGESWDDRLDLLFELRDIAPDSLPINFLVPIPGTPLGKAEVITEWDAIKVIALARFIMPTIAIRLAGGRLEVFENPETPILAGASAIMLGDLLTVRGRTPQDDLQMIATLS